MKKRICDSWQTPCPSGQECASSAFASSAGTTSAGASSAGTTSAGTSSAGTSSAGASSAGTSSAGTSSAGTYSAGTSSAGASSAGASSAGASSAGTSSAGTYSASSAGTSSAGASNAGTSSAGTTSAGTSSAGASSAGTSNAGASSAGTSSAGASNAGASSAGTTSAGTSSAGASSAGTSSAGTSSAGASSAVSSAGASSAGAPAVATWSSLTIDLYISTLGTETGIAQSLGCWARCPARCSVTGSTLLWASAQDFFLGVNMGLTPFPRNSFCWEYTPRSSLCTHAFHRTDSKDPDIHVLDGWMPAAETHPACTIHEDRMWLPLYLNLNTHAHTQKKVTYAKISLTMANPRDNYSWERRRRRSTLGTLVPEAWSYCVRTGWPGV